MTRHTPLPPDLQQFVREQLAAGRFQSEGEIIRAAFHLLERHSPPRPAAGKPAADATPDASHKPSGGRRSPRGILTDLQSGISFDEVKDARSEIWSGFPRGGT